MPLKKILAALIFIGISVQVSAQSSQCELTLNQATDEFNSGHFYEIPALLKPCLDRNDFTNEQRVRAYLLLSQAYLIIDDPISAEDSYLKLLKADPEYVATKEKDPIDVVYLSSKFTSTPVFTPHIRLGGNTSFFRAINNRSTDENNTTNSDGDKVKNILKLGFQLGAGMDWNIDNHWSLAVNGIFSSKGYKTVTSNFYPFPPSGVPESSTLTVTERQYWIDIPLYLKYSADKGKIRPFGYGGVAANLLLSAKGPIVFNRNTGPGVETDQGPDVTFNARKFFNRSFVMGGGVLYKFGKDFIMVDVRYMAGLSNLTGKDIYSMALTRHYVDPYFRLDNLSLSVGYVRPLYNPRRIKKTTMKGIMHLFDRQKKQ